MIGQTISHYHILEKLGEGGMGVVYKAQDLMLDRLVALKFLPSHLTASEEIKKRFIQEAKAASTLDHPNICTLYELGETNDGQMFIAMAYYKGETVKERVKERPLPISEAVEIAAAIAEGLTRAHEKGITHRDIKSDNVMITDNGSVKIMDFGLASMVGASTLTKAGTTLGTLPYMSPEQARGEKVDHRTDIWSLGVLLYEMVAGRLPFKSQYDEATVYSILHEKPQPLTSIRSNVPMALESVVHKCLEKKASDRYQHMDDMLVDLRRAGTEKHSTGHTHLAPPKTGRRQWLIIGGLSLVVLVLCLIFIPRFIPGSEDVHSLAVLPLENFSHDPDQEYFSDGMTEALIADLSKITSLRVISRTSVMQFKGTKKTVPEIARALNVDAVLEGSVLRSGDRIRITAQLIHGSTDKHLWAESYERELKDVLRLQSDVAQAIAGEIRIKVTPQEHARITGSRTVNPSAHEAYLKGRFYANQWSPEAGTKSIEFFRQSIAIDSTYAPAYAELAEMYVTLGFSGVSLPRELYVKAKAAAVKALALDESSGEAHAALGWLTLMNDWNWEESEREFRRSLELNPSSTTTLFFYSTLLSARGRHTEAIKLAKLGRSLDPLSLLSITNVGWRYQSAGIYDTSIAYFQKCLELDSNYSVARENIAFTSLLKGLPDEAIRQFKTVPEASMFPISKMRLAVAYVRAGRRKDALKIVEDLQERFRHGYVSPYCIAGIYSALGEKNLAFQWLERAYSDRDSWLIFIHLNPGFESLRSDPRFDELLKKTGAQR